MKKKNATKLMMVLLLGLMVTILVGGSPGIAASVEDKDELVVATAYDAKSLDPHAVNDVASSNIMLQIYDTLITIDENGKIKKSLAKSYEQIDDLTYKFTIKKGIKFHNGEEMTADDVKFSIKRAADSAPNAHIFGDVDKDSVKTHDKYTVSFKLNQPNTGFLPALAHSSGSILNHNAVEAAGDNYGMHPVGSGPFKFVSWHKGAQVVLEKFDDYYGKEPAFNRMVIRTIPEANSRIIELETGGVDVAYEINANSISRIKNDPDLKLLRKLDNSIQYLGFQTQKEPFTDKKVRKAIRYAVNTEAAVKVALRGVGEIAKGPMSPNMKYYDDSLEIPETNIEKAKELLAEAGYPNGFKTTLWTDEKEMRVNLATIVQSMLKKVGIDANIKILEWGAYLDSLSNGEQDMFFIGWTAQTTDPDIALYGPLSKKTIGAGANFTYFENDRINELLIKGRKVTDSPERATIYKEIQNIVMEEAPLVPLFHNEVVIGTADYVENLEISPFGYHPLYKIRFEE